MTRRFNPSRDDLSENPPSMEHLLRGFQGRPVKQRKRAIIPLDSLQGAKLLGRSDVIFYQSDKRDPKDPDGEGAQGVRKRFYHDQRPPSYLYVISQDGELDDFQQEMVDICQKKGLVKKVHKEGLYPKGDFPQQIVELADLEKIEISIGKDDFELTFVDYKLFVWDDMRTLMALPISNGEVTDSCIYIWCSNHTKVNWRGIID